MLEAVHENIDASVSAMYIDEAVVLGPPKLRLPFSVLIFQSVRCVRAGIHSGSVALSDYRTSDFVKLQR